MRPHRDFLTVSDFSRPELDALFALAARMKRGAYRKRPLAGQALAMIFTKSSTRTRVSFEVGAYQLGAHSLFLSPRDAQLGRGEPIADTARVLSRMCDGIMIRTHAHTEIEEFAKVADIPVINGLTDEQHPCQILADLFTVHEALGGYRGKRIAWIGDGNNMANSWLDAASVLGFELRIACPEGYMPNPDLVELAKVTMNVALTNDPHEAADGAHVELCVLTGPTSALLVMFREYLRIVFPGGNGKVMRLVLNGLPWLDTQWAVGSFLRLRVIDPRRSLP